MRTSSLLTADVYRNRKTDFVGEITNETPNVFIEPVSLGADIERQLESELGDPAYDELNSVIDRLDATERGGNGNGSSTDELTMLLVLGSSGTGASTIPMGTVSPEEATDPTAVILTYRNFGAITHYGVDLSFTYYANDALTVGGSYSYLSENVFPTRFLNAPKDKYHAGFNYRHAQSGVTVATHFRHRGGYPMSSGVFAGDVEASTLVDIDVSYELPIQSPQASATLSLNTSNVFDRLHREFVGAPEIGRLVTGGLTVRF